MQISECMSRDVKLARLDDTLQSAARSMAQIDAGFLPVAEEDHLIGIVTDRDIAFLGIGTGCGPDAHVGEIISAEVKYCFDDQESEDVLENMAEIQVRRLPVVDRDKRLVGIVSLGDLAGNGEDALVGDTIGDIAHPSGQHSQSL